MRAVCVFCGSSPGRRPDYVAGARRLGHALAERGVRLVYGGASVGVMGAVADAVLERGGEALGVIPRSLWDREVGHTGLTELRVVDSMHERKAAMAELADAFVCLPGGLGTLEELFEIWTWGQLGLHRKPYGLLNVAGYFDPLLAFLDHSVEERFVRPRHRALLHVHDEPEALIAELRAAHVPPETPWIEPGET